MMAFRISMILAAAVALVSTAQTQPEPKEQGNPATTQPATDPQPDPNEPPPMPTAEDIIKKFESERPDNTPIRPTERPRDSYNNERQKDKTLTTRYPDGFMLVDRSGRVVKDGDWWIFSFQTSNIDTKGTRQDKPMKLLPNRMLERLLFEAQGSEVNPVFVVTGEITDFKGENYLLLRKILRQRADANLTE